MPPLTLNGLLMAISLDYADPIAVFFEDFIDVFPTRAIHEAAVNEDYGLHG
jgi:hypothetical protein